LPTQTELPAREDDESSMDENESGRSTVPDVFRAKAKVHHSHIWLPENGIEIEEEGRVRWKCMRCRDPKSAKTFAVSTTKNTIDHLKSKHSIGYGGEVIKPGPEPHQQTIERAFSTDKPTITFNEDVCRQLLLRWIVKMNISFRVCEDESFRTYCSYLAACKPDYSAIHRAIPTSGNSIKRFLLSYHQEMKAEVTSRLRLSPFKIHYSFDM
jgi:hypothetical protein